jgi:hypothetical protein
MALPKSLRSEGEVLMSWDLFQPQQGPSRTGATPWGLA